MHMEKIKLAFFSTLLHKKHLHAHGENVWLTGFVLVLKETPPCTWRKLPRRKTDKPSARNTSMHMEKILYERDARGGTRKHLHAHGENFLVKQPWDYVLETPPCTWRKFRNPSLIAQPMRNTSMHMEKIASVIACSTSLKKHLHAHGEN